MRIALIDGSPKKKGRLYPLPLLKIGAWRKDKGDEVVLFMGELPAAGEFDEIWITTRFTFEIPFAVGLVREAKNRAKRVLVGGISATLLPEYFENEGVEVHKGLLPDAEHYAPDYSILGYEPKYSITHTSRGCIRKCGFCMVTRLEPEFTNEPGWDKSFYPGATDILFYDNNWLAKPMDELRADVEKMKKLIADGRITSMDFNQGLDARLVTDEIADLLEGLPIKPIRFAFDGMHEDGHYQDAIRKMAAHGFNDFTSYVLYNFKDTPKDFYYRLKESTRLGAELISNVNSFPMRYQPILDIDKARSYVGTNWTSKKLKAFMVILGKWSTGGTVSTRSIEDFEYWLGKTPDEFDRLLNYPRLRELIEKRKGNKRQIRAKAAYAKKDAKRLQNITEDG